jgi:cytochrome c553
MKMKRRFGKAAMWLVVIVAVAVLVMPVAAQNRRAQSRPVVDLPRGPVRQVILDNCTACHGIDDYAYYAMDRQGWQKLVDSMKEKGVVISDDDRSILLDWLVTKFGPDAKPFPKVRTKTVLNLGGDVAARDAAAKQFIDTACRTCHTLERVDVAKFTGEKWRDIVTDMKNKGADVGDDDVAPLVEYFTRTHGTN